ncbi:MAG TPA: ATP-dependent DNA ligase [Galbitalea sp.]|jgi:hypothetical protein|nr:ATP-dependent DNA ligase [Galbitalea sp.]
MDDRALTHLQIVIVNKLRKGESFVMSWKDSPDVGDGRSAVWMHPHMLLYFKFDGGRVPAINEEWLAELAESADSSRGLVVTAERGDLPELDQRRRRENPETVLNPARSVEPAVPLD